VTTDEIITQSDKCVKCGICKAHCPTFDIAAHEGSSARGRVVLVNALLTGKLQPSGSIASRLYSCLLCGLCEPLCPVGVNITAIIYEGLATLAATDDIRGKRRKLTHTLFTKPALLFGLGKFAGPAIKPALKAMGMPFDIKLPSRSLRSGATEYKPEGKINGKVALFTGCAINYMYPHLGEALINVLTSIGYEVVLPKDEVCCGAPLSSLGMKGEAQKLARENIEAFRNLDVEAVLSLCPTCTLGISKHYRDTIGDEIDGAQDAIGFLADKIELSPSYSASAAYHAPCHQSSGLSIKQQPLDMIRDLGFDLKPIKQECCGFSQAPNDPNISDTLLQINSSAAQEVDTLITSCPGCMAQLARKHPKVKHLIELMDTGKQ
jgi:glycolate oxidase iron-sulfur subunit